MHPRIIAAGLITAISAMAHANPPALVQVVREPIKAGDEAAYEAVETETAAACVELGCPHPHLATETLTARKEIWWFNFFESEAQRLGVTRAYESNRPLMEALVRNSQRKSEYTAEITDTIYHYRPELGRGSRWNLLGARYVVVVPGRAAIDAGGPVFAASDSAYISVRFFKTSGDVERFAASASGAIVLRIRPSWGLPAEEWIAADREFWSTNPVVSRREP